jgi:hypothetical protein
MFMTDRSGSYDTPECHPGQQAYTFLIRILSTSFISVPIFSVCCYSRVSISMMENLFSLWRTTVLLDRGGQPIVFFESDIRYSDRLRLDPISNSPIVS